jgi:hypothetical protein
MSSASDSDDDAGVAVHVDVGLGGRGLEADGVEDAPVLAKPKVSPLLDPIKRLGEFQDMSGDVEPVGHLNVYLGVDELLCGGFVCVDLVRVQIFGGDGLE